MVRRGYSLSMTFGHFPLFKLGEAWEQLSALLYNVYTDDLNNQIQATVVGCYVEGT